MGIQNVLLDELNKQGAFFDVREEPLVTTSGIAVARKAVIRKDTNEVVGVVGSKYRVVTNEEAFSKFAKALEASSLHTDGAMIKAEHSHGGGRTFSQIVLPEHVMEMPSRQEHDKSAMRIILKNSVDGSTAFTCIAGAFRFVCSNGMITGDHAASYSSRHIQSLDIGVAAAKISKMLENFSGSFEQFEEMTKVEVTDALAWEAMARVAKLPKEVKSGMPNNRYEWHPTMALLMRVWENNRRILGGNAWALYNSLTEWATHYNADRGDKNSAASRYGREESVATFMQSQRGRRILSAA